MIPGPYGAHGSERNMNCSKKQLLHPHLTQESFPGVQLSPRSWRGRGDAGFGWLIQLVLQLLFCIQFLLRRCLHSFFLVDLWSWLRRVCVYSRVHFWTTQCLRVEELYLVLFKEPKVLFPSELLNPYRSKQREAYFPSVELLLHSSLRVDLITMGVPEPM